MALQLEYGFRCDVSGCHLVNRSAAEGAEGAGRVWSTDVLAILLFALTLW